MRIFTGIQSLSTAVRQAARQDCALVTFDLFDTLLLRLVSRPDQIKAPVARYIAARAAGCGIRIDWRRILQLRLELEQRQRALNVSRQLDREAVYPVFMDELLRVIFGDSHSAGLLKDVTDLELRLECAILRPRHILLELLRELRQCGKRIWILSDTYLPSSHLAVILQSTGLRAMIDGVTSSADECRTKASGAAFQRLADKLGIGPERWLHVGDNIFADGRQPTAFGIRAFVLRDAGEFRRHMSNRALAGIAHILPQARGALWRRLAQPLHGANMEIRWRIGHDFFGPLAASFVLHIAEQARSRNLSRVYFFSREGEVLMNIWQKAAPFWFPDGSAPEARYLKVSRAALAPATCAHQGLTRRNAGLVLLAPGRRTLLDVCRFFGLNPDTLQHHFARYRLQSDSPLKQNLPAFYKLLLDRDFQNTVREQTAERGRLVENYLRQEGLLDLSAAAVVDIGWLGTIQRFLNESIAHHPQKPQLHGFLMGFTGGPFWPRDPGNIIEGFLHDARRGCLSAPAFTCAPQVFEEAFRAPSPGIAGYRSANGRVEPIETAIDDPSRSLEQEQDLVAAPILAGMVDFAGRAAPLATILDYSSDDLHPWLRLLLMRRMLFPRTSEVVAMRPRHHCDPCRSAADAPRLLSIPRTGVWGLSPAWLRWIPGLRLFSCCLQMSAAFLAQRRRLSAFDPP
ncbi:MAG: HAD family hydrolase [Kiritimatiellia bacterium]